MTVTLNRKLESRDAPSAPGNFCLVALILLENVVTSARGIQHIQIVMFYVDFILARTSALDARIGRAAFHWNMTREYAPKVDPMLPVKYVDLP